MMRRLDSKQQGFTIVELMIATTIFSFILLFVTNAIVRIGKVYYTGTQQTRTQETARNIIEEISRGIQFGGGSITTTKPVKSFFVPFPLDPPIANKVHGTRSITCVNGFVYAAIMDKKLVEIQPATPDPFDRQDVLTRYKQSCGYPLNDQETPRGAKTNYPGSATELLGFGMRLTQFSVDLVPGTTDTYTVTVEVASGSRDLFNPTWSWSTPLPLPDTIALNSISTGCKPSEGKQFCTMSKLTTTVKRRAR